MNDWDMYDCYVMLLNVMYDLFLELEYHCHDLSGA